MTRRIRPSATQGGGHKHDGLADFTRDKSVIILSAMGIVIGGFSAVISWVLVLLIGLITNVSFYGRWSTRLINPDTTHLGPYLVLVPVVGGLIIGVMARFGSEKIRGHGIPEALEAILVGRSRMEPKVAVLKPISSAISIGTGGPFGAEGPIIMTGGAFGSLFAQMFHLSPAQRKTLLVAGAAGGMAAIFASPVAAVLISVELLLFEWKPRSFIPVAVSSLVASMVRIPLLGNGPVFPVVAHPAVNYQIVIAAFLVGIIAGLGSTLLTTLVYGFEDLFSRLPIHWMWWPAIGGLFVGVGGLVNPRVLGVGYDTIGALLNGQLIGAAALGLLISKGLVWSIALGSGTSGGVLAPLLIMGGATGALLARWIPAGDTALWTIIGMAAMMGGTMRSPLTAMVFALELTHDLNLLPALLAGCVAAHGVTVLLLRRSILTEKIARRGHHIAREYTVDPMETKRVGDVMDPHVAAVPLTMRVSELSRKVAGFDPALNRHHGYPIVDDKGLLVGMITRGDIFRAQSAGNDPTVVEAGSGTVIVAYPDELLRDAADRMLMNNVGRLPVVTRENPRRVIGYLGRVGVLQARHQRIVEEHVRESGWLGKTAGVRTLM